MAIDYENCEAYFRGEIRPIIFEIYTESGIPFRLVDNVLTLGDDRVCCEVRDENNKLIETITGKVISDEAASKKFVVSWDTSKYEIGYYRLRVWALVNVSGAQDNSGNMVIEGKLCSDEIIRYIKE